MPNATQLLPKTIEIRALGHIENGVDPIEAVKIAIEEENNLIWLLMGVDMKTGCSSSVGKEVISIMSESVYNRINSVK